MIDWIKFAERQPEKEGCYLYYGSQAIKPQIAEWVKHKNASCFCHSERSPLEILKIPDYWAEINPPKKKEPPMPEIPLCKDCKWIDEYLDHKCLHPNAPRSLVDGSPKWTCAEIRPAWAGGGSCGPEGRWFEAKEEADSQETPLMALVRRTDENYR